MTELIKGNENISPTAWTIAHRRTFTDIPYSKPIFDLIEQQRKLQGIEISEELKSPQIAPQIEARYKLVNIMLEENNIKQVLEIAAGFSPRGLAMTDDASVTYVETDLSKITKQMDKIVGKIGKKENLFIENADVLDLRTLQSSLKHFDKRKSLGIIHEGLLRYLSFDQKAVVAKNIHTILESFDGVWITPDISLKSIVKAETFMGGKFEKIKERIGINIDNNLFDNVEHAQKFFENLGFTVEKHNFMEVKDLLASPKVLGQSEGLVDKLIGGAYVFVMKIK